MARSGLFRPRLLAFVALAMVLLGLKMAHDTLKPPFIRHVALSLNDEQSLSGEPLRVVLLADIHVAGPDMPPSRLARIVEQVNALEPDLVLIAGDLVSDKRTATHLYDAKQALAPLGGLKASHGVIAVPGNHDHWRGMEGIARELTAKGVTLLENEVTERAGLTIAGLDDDFTGRADIQIVERAQEETGKPMLVLSHSPDPFPALPQGFGVMLAGHTHCGQVGWPWGGSPATMSRYGQRYACGVVRENGNVVVTSGGLGTSVLPFRLFTQPEIWLIELTLGSVTEDGAAPVR